jgi:hypothetical protein
MFNLRKNRFQEPETSVPLIKKIFDEAETSKKVMADAKDVGLYQSITRHYDPDVAKAMIKERKSLMKAHTSIITADYGSMEAYRAQLKADIAAEEAEEKERQRKFQANRGTRPSKPMPFALKLSRTL